MKNSLLLLAVFGGMLSFQACTKCGHCETTTIDPFTGGQFVSEDVTYCGDFEKSGKINCERADDESDAFTSYKWVEDK